VRGEAAATCSELLAAAIMSRNWPITQATDADSAGIALLFAMSWRSPFSRLQFGDVDPLALSAVMAPRIRQQMELRHVSFMVIRSPVTQEVVAVAQWTIPVEESGATEEAQDEDPEQQILDDEVYRNKLPEYSNKDLIMDFTIGLRELRRRILRSQKHYLLDNLATHAEYRGQGLASRLIEHILPQAEAQNTVVYLETASDNPAARMYRRLGFEERGGYTIEDLTKFVPREELERCGGISAHTHMAFVKRPDHGRGLAGDV
jgi:ribosomal protein S18 acetylase RimI-like enzyme